MRSSYFRNFRSSLQYHHLWLTGPCLHGIKKEIQTHLALCGNISQNRSSVQLLVQSFICTAVSPIVHLYSCCKYSTVVSDYNNTKKTSFDFNFDLSFLTAWIHINRNKEKLSITWKLLFDYTCKLVIEKSLWTIKTLEKSRLYIDIIDYHCIKKSQAPTQVVYILKSLPQKRHIAPLGI